MLTTGAHSRVASHSNGNTSEDGSMEGFAW